MKHTEYCPTRPALEQVVACLEPNTKVKFHFANKTMETYPNLFPIFSNRTARVNSIYIGTDGVLHIITLDDYRGY